MRNKDIDMENQGEIILYQPDEVGELEVRLEDETVWLTQAQIAELFGTEVPAISKHIRNIIRSEEFEEEATVSKMETVRLEGSRKGELLTPKGMRAHNILRQEIPSCFRMFGCPFQEKDEMHLLPPFDEWEALCFF